MVIDFPTNKYFSLKINERNVAIDIMIGANAKE